MSITMAMIQVRKPRVPRGSILGLLLFILYKNDFSRNFDLLFSILFTDDTSVFIEWINYVKVIDRVNNIWLRANKLIVNIKKTHFMMFYRTSINGKCARL